MPRIPTFTSTAKPTTDVGGIKSGIQISPTSTVAAALLPAADAITNYSIKKRDNEEKLIAKKAVLELKAESDKIIQSQKDNISEDESINNWKTTFTPLINQKLSTIKNRRVKKLVESSIDLENSESIYHLKQNSFKAYEKESAKIYNDEINLDVAKFKSETNPILKNKYKDQLYLKAELYNEEHMLGKNDLKKRIEAIDSVLLLTDADSLIGTPNAVEKIKQLDKDINGTKFLSDEIFNNSIYNSYKEKIESISVKGDPNSNYEEAKKLLNELENFERYNGNKTISGKRETEFATLKQKILTEQIQHENLLEKQVDNKAFLDFSNDSKISLLKTITDNKAGIPPTLEDRLIANEIESEYDQMIRDYLDADPEATLINKKSFVRNLTFSLSNIYQDRKISKIKSRSFTEDTFDIIAEKNRVMEDVKLLALDELDVTTRIRYQRIAKAQGYVTTVNIDGKQKKIGDIGAYLNDYLPILKRQVKAIEIVE